MDTSVAHEQFQDLLEIADVTGVALFSNDGSPPRLAVVESSALGDAACGFLAPLVEGLSGASEAELAFENGRLYLRRTGAGTLVVMLDPFASVSLVRLQCDVLIPALEESGKRRTSRGFWGRGRG